MRLVMIGIGIIVVILIVILAIVLAMQKSNDKQSPSISSNVPTSNMQLTSPVFNNNQNIPSKFTCDGEGVSPALNIAGVPQEAKSLALIVDDPDAPRGDWVHWLVWNIKPETKEIAEGSAPSGAEEGTNDSGKAGWVGPCPPSGTHHYQFDLYALDAELSLSSSARKSDLEKAMSGHILAQTTLVGLYRR